MLKDEIIKNLTPIELEYIQSLNENLEKNNENCPYCGSIHIVKKEPNLKTCYG